MYNVSTCMYFVYKRVFIILTGMNLIFMDFIDVTLLANCSKAEYSSKGFIYNL